MPLTAKDMVPGKPYIVTRASKHREFQVGDHVRLMECGDILCPEADGWMPAEDVPEATEGMLVEVDQAALEKRRAKLQAQLAALGE